MWKLNPAEIMRDINHIISNAVDNTAKINRFGIEDIKFEVVNTENVSTGIKLTIEAQGTTLARNPDHIKRQLEKLMLEVKQPLASKNIYMQMFYNNIDTNDSVEESYDTAIGLTRKIDFRIMCVAISKSPVI